RDWSSDVCSSDLIANQEFGRLYPIVAAIGERIPDLHSLKGTGKVVREELVNELYENFYDVARRFNGVHQTNLPWGAADVRIVRNPDGSGVLEYVDKQGKVVRRTEPLDYAEAQASLREVKDAL